MQASTLALKTVSPLLKGIGGLAASRDTARAAAIGIKAMGSLAKGIAGERAGSQERAAFYEAAREEELAGNAQALLLRDQARAAIGEQFAAQFGNGFEGGTGTATDSLAQSQINAALDVLELRRQAGGRARAYRTRGDLAASEGHFALAEGLIGLGSEISGGVADWGDATRGQTLQRRRGAGSDIVVTRGGSLY